MPLLCIRIAMACCAVAFCSGIAACGDPEPQEYMSPGHAPQASSDSRSEGWSIVNQPGARDTVRRRLDMPANAIVLRKGETAGVWPFLADSLFFFCVDDVPFFWDSEGNVYGVNSESIDSGYAPIPEELLVRGVGLKFLISIVEENCRRF